MEKKLSDFLNQYFKLEIVPGRKVRIPYWRNKFFKNGKRIQGPLGGKGTPAEIKKAALKKAKKAKINLNQLEAWQIKEFMKQERIGLDCSGFAFQILNFLKPGFYRKLEKAPGKSLNPIRRFNAASLTSKENSRPIRKIEDLKVGDLIPLSFNSKSIDHVLVIVQISKKEIIYAHSSSKGKITGPHLGKIKIVAFKKGLEKQIWLEKTKEGLGLQKFAYRPLSRIKIRRTF